MINIFASFLSLVFLFNTNCMAQSVSALDTYLKTDKFNFEEAPVKELGEPLNLWATHYNLPEFQDGSGDIPLRDSEGVELGPTLGLAEWCRSALEGSVRIMLKNGEERTYNYHTSTELFPNDCSSYFPFNIGKTKFRIANGPFGDGIASYQLSPFRTLATDPLLIPTGTVLYVPDARGALINLPNGKRIVHDGYFFAGDIGGAIKLNHVDVFIGTNENSSFFPWIRHTSALTFKAYKVIDTKIIRALTQFHLR
ncbi:MAG: 3D domain-containing protein [Bacteriovorax sp.]|jgi:3D (Asp-Asp-Asp) domain-containing protein